MVLKRTKLSWVLGLVLAATSAIGGDGQVLPSELCRGLWIVPLRFERSGKTLNLVLDTGAAGTSIDPDSLSRIGNTTRAGRKTTLRDADIGPLRVRKIRVRSHEMDHLSRALGRRIDGILGFDSFRDLLLTLDYGTGEVRVAEGRLPAEGPGILRDYGKSRPFVAVTLGETRKGVLLDSGSGGGWDLHDDDPLPWKVAPRTSGAAARYDRIELDRAGRIEGSLRLGDLEFREPIVEVDGGTRLVGYEVLRHYSITFDQRSQRIQMQSLLEGPIDELPRRGTGLALKPTDHGFEVFHIFSETVSRAGVRTGDRLVAVDGRPIDHRGCVDLVDAEIETIRMTFEREGREFPVELPQVVVVP